MKKSILILILLIAVSCKSSKPSCDAYGKSSKSESKNLSKKKITENLKINDLKKSNLQTFGIRENSNSSKTTNKSLKKADLK